MCFLGWIVKLEVFGVKMGPIFYEHSCFFFFSGNGWGKPPLMQLNRSFGKQATMLDGCLLKKFLQNEGSSIA